MSVSNYYGAKSKYRITLELDVLDDFNPHDIAWDKVFNLDSNNESAKCYIEDIS